MRWQEGVEDHGNHDVARPHPNARWRPSSSAPTPYDVPRRDPSAVKSRSKCTSEQGSCNTAPGGWPRSPRQTPPGGRDGCVHRPRVRDHPPTTGVHTEGEHGQPGLRPDPPPGMLRPCRPPEPTGVEGERHDPPWSWPRSAYRRPTAVPALEMVCRWREGPDSGGRAGPAVAVPGPRRPCPRRSATFSASASASAMAVAVAAAATSRRCGIRPHGDALDRPGSTTNMANSMLQYQTDHQGQHHRRGSPCRRSSPHCTEPLLANRVAPTSPPNSACEADEGMPKYQVIRVPDDRRRARRRTPRRGWPGRSGELTSPPDRLGDLGAEMRAGEVADEPPAQGDPRRQRPGGVPTSRSRSRRHENQFV